MSHRFGRALTPFLGLCLVGSAVLTVNEAKELAPVALAKYSGVLTEATITDKTWVPSEGRRISYEIRLPSGESFSQRVPVRSGVYDSAEPGSSLTVRYLAEDPSTSVLADGDLLFFGTLFHMALWLVVALLIGYGFLKGLQISRTVQRAT